MTTVADLDDRQIDTVLREIESLVGTLAALREEVHGELAPCTPRAFVTQFVERLADLGMDPLVVP